LENIGAKFALPSKVAGKITVVAYISYNANFYILVTLEKSNVLYIVDL
jgi:hypothetical protein